MTVIAPPRRHSRPALIALVLVTAIAAGAGCTPSTPKSDGSRVDVTVKDFAIAVSRHTVPAGTVVLHMTNDGPSTHEVNVDRTHYASAYIPRERDGLTADESAPGLRRIDSIEQLDLHHTDDLTVHLRPGRYVLWCNLEGHYLGGMHETIDVVAGDAR